MRLKKQRDDLSGYLKAHNDGFVIDDITWNDLGMDFVYDRINYCETSSGVEYLYYMLRAPRTRGLILLINWKKSFPDYLMIRI